MFDIYKYINRDENANEKAKRKLTTCFISNELLIGIGIVGC